MTLPDYRSGEMPDMSHSGQFPDEEPRVGPRDHPAAQGTGGVGSAGVADYEPVAFGEHGKLAPRDPWVHRSQGMRCSTCMWWAAKAGLRTDIGCCRRHAPTMQGYPVVVASDWCGDHKLDEGREEAPGGA